jgi:hypothetical protein
MSKDLHKLDKKIEKNRKIELKSFIREMSLVKVPNFDTDIPYVEGLYEVYNDIYNTLLEHEEFLKNMKNAKMVKVEYILDLAQRITLTEHAPKGWKEGHPFINAFPPTPIPEYMRAGKLAAYNESVKEANIAATTAPKLNKQSGSTSKKANAMSFMLKMKEQIKALRDSQQGASQEGQSSQSIAMEATDDTTNQTNTRKSTISFATFDSDEEDED